MKLCLYIFRMTITDCPHFLMRKTCILLRLYQESPCISILDDLCICIQFQVLFFSDLQKNCRKSRISISLFDVAMVVDFKLTNELTA